MLFHPKCRMHRPALPSLILSNVRSLANKRDKLSVLIGSQRDFRYAAAICLSETWLNEDIPNSTVQQAGFSLYCADCTTDSLKQQGGGVCCYINRNWCTDTKVLSRTCSPVLESLTVMCKQQLADNLMEPPPQGGRDHAGRLQPCLAEESSSEVQTSDPHRHQAG